MKGHCVHHNGFIYDVATPDLVRYLPSKVFEMLTKIDYDLINDPDQREELERRKNRFRWICCDGTVTTGGGAGGCKKGKHSCGEQTGPNQRAGKYLNSELIKQWEEQCYRNPEYNEKWHVLVKSQAETMASRPIFNLWNIH